MQRLSICVGLDVAINVAKLLSSTQCRTIYIADSVYYPDLFGLFDERHSRAVARCDAMTGEIVWLCWQKEFA